MPRFMKRKYRGGGYMATESGPNYGKRLRTPNTNTGACIGYECDEYKKGGSLYKAMYGFGPDARAARREDRKMRRLGHDPNQFDADAIEDANLGLVKRGGSLTSLYQGKFNIGGGFSSNTNWGAEQKYGSTTIGVERGLIRDKQGKRQQMAYGYAKKGGSCKFGCATGPNKVL